VEVGVVGEGPEASVELSAVSLVSIVSYVTGNQQYVFLLYSCTYYYFLFSSARIGFQEMRIRSDVSL
jgi:hypothetical protein